jgi:hypothetical protein
MTASEWRGSYWGVNPRRGWQNGAAVPDPSRKWYSNLYSHSDGLLRTLSRIFLPGVLRIEFRNGDPPWLLARLLLIVPHF